MELVSYGFWKWVGHMLSKILNFAVLVFTVCYPSLSFSQETPEEADGWHLSCLAQSVCEIRRDITHNSEVAASLKVLNSNSNFWLQYIIPVGISIEQGIQISVDAGEMLVSTISNCTVRGCAGRIDLSPDFVAQMKRGGSLNVFFVDPRSHEIFTIQFSLSGFNNAFGALINGLTSNEG